MDDFDDEDEFDDDFFDEGVADWLYVEETYNDADDLAEHTCPSPPLQSTVPDIDIDPYEYFIDLDYLSDSYYDGRADENLRRVGKRKLRERTQNKKSSSSNKRRKTNAKSRGDATKPSSTSRLPNVIRVPQHQRSRDPSFYLPVSRASELASLPSIALFPDWRSRFESRKGFDVNIGDDPGSFDIPGRGSGYSDKINRHADRGSSGESEEADEGQKIDLGNLKNVAELLSEEQITQIQEMMKAKGLDPDALDTVLGDLVEGREREFDSNDEAELDEVDDEHHGEDRPASDNADLHQSATSTATEMTIANGHASAHPGNKRKAELFDLGDPDEEAAPGVDQAATTARLAKRGRIQFEDDEPANVDAKAVNRPRISKFDKKRKATTEDAEIGTSKRVKTSREPVHADNANTPANSSQPHTTRSTRSRRK